MRINQAGCNLKECRYFADYNCRDANRHATCPYARLHELEVQNRLYELPCAVLTPYWEIVEKLFAEFGTKQCEQCPNFNQYDGTCDYIFNIENDEDYIQPCSVIVERRFLTVKEIISKEDQIGKTIFFDKDEAQKKLDLIKAKENNNG